MKYVGLRMSPLLVLTVAVACAWVVNGENCTTTDGEVGHCIDILRCGELKALLLNKVISNDDKEKLRKAHCGFDDNKPKVCCPGERPASSDSTTVEDDSVDNIIPADARRQRRQASCAPTVGPPQPGYDCCGLQTSKVDLGGDQTEIDDYPWTALIEYKKNDKTKVLCGGSLVSSRYVLTAAHCVTGPVLKAGSPMNVRLSEYNLEKEGQDCKEVAAGGTDCTDGHLSIPIEKIIRHPDYDTKGVSKDHDIALIKLAKEAPYNDFIRPICLPTRDISASPPDNLVFVIVGWGGNHVRGNNTAVKLQDTNVKYKTREECQNTYKSYKVNIGPGQMCAQDSCKGDSGGALIYEDKGIAELTGITSFGPVPCGKKHPPGVYTNVYHYDAWIRQNMV